MEEEIMEIMMVGVQNSSGERKEGFFALALDLIPGLQHAVVSWCQAQRPLLLAETNSPSESYTPRGVVKRD